MLDAQEEFDRVKAYTALNQTMYDILRFMALNPSKESVPYLSAFGMGVLAGMGMAYESVINDTPIDLDDIMFPDTPEGA